VVDTDGEATALDELAAKQVDTPLLRFGGEDFSAALDPSVNTNVIGASPIEAADYGLRNVDRVIPFLITGTTRLGGGYDRLEEMYEALIQHRHRQLSAVAKLVGGVEEIRYQAGRGTTPFNPIPPAQQRAAVKFLVKRAFSVPRPLLDREILMRIAPFGAADALQGSNVKLLRQLLSSSVFQRMAEAEAMNPGAKIYTGLEMLRDLNDGLFKELAAARPTVEYYRRELQRSYVLLLLAATGTTADPEAESHSIPAQDQRTKSVVQRFSMQQRAASSLADVVQHYRTDGKPSEARSALRVGVKHLREKMEAAVKRVKDPITKSHLQELTAELGKVP
jgi:hypothetical protein